MLNDQLAKNVNRSFKIFEMFSGYCGASFALKKAGIPFECIGISEIDKNAIKCTETNFPHYKNFGDCTQINTKELPDFDLLTGGFPCQDVSIAGHRDLTKGRTNLYKEILRIVADKKPKYMLLENVAGIISMKVDGRRMVDVVTTDLRKLGYGVMWKSLNSKDFGIPQSRERVWFVCKLGGWEFNEFQWPKEEKLKIFIKDILETNVDKKYNLKEKQIKFINDALRLKKGYTQINGTEALCQTGRQFASWGGDYIQFDISGKGYKSQQDRAYPVEGVMGCLPSDRGDNKVNIFAIRGREEDNIQTPEIREDGCSNSLTSVEKDNLVVEVHNMQPRSPDRPSLQYSSGGSGHLSKKDGTTYCLDTWNCQANGLTQKETEKYLNETHKQVYGDSNERKKRYQEVREVLSRVWKEIRKEKISEWNIGRLPSFSEEEILQPNMYERKLQIKMERRCPVTTRECESKTINTGFQMRDLWENDKIRYTSQRQEQIEQLFRELTSALQKLPYETTSDKTEMQDMWITDERFRIMQQTLYKDEERTTTKLTNVYRRLSPRECFRLQGFLHDEINLEGISDSGLYKLAGNGWCLSPVHLILKEMLKNEKELIMTNPLPSKV